MLLKVSSAQLSLLSAQAELTEASIKGAAKGELSSSYALLTAEPRQASVKGATDLRVHSAHG